MSRHAFVLFAVLASPQVLSAEPDTLSRPLLGSVIGVDAAGGQVKVKTSDGDATVKVDDRTKITRGGETASMDALEKGSVVSMTVEPGPAPARAAAIALTGFFANVTKRELEPSPRLTVKTHDGKTTTVVVTKETALTKVPGRDAVLGDFTPGEKVWLTLSQDEPAHAVAISLAVGDERAPGIVGGKPKAAPPRD